MPAPIRKAQCCRDAAAECRWRARVARSPKTSAAYERLARHYDGLVDAELKREPPCVFRCPATGCRVAGIPVDESPDENPDAYVPVTCLEGGLIHLVNLKTGRTIGEEGED